MNKADMETDATPSSIEDSSLLPLLLIGLLKGVQYQESDPKRWGQLLSLLPQVRDYMSVLGLELILDEAEGYAFLRSRNDEEQEPNSATPAQQLRPRLIARRPLSFPVSLLLALLRKKLAEFDASSGDTRLVLTRDEIVDLIRIFLPDSSNEAKLVDQIERHINKVIELGFLRCLKQATKQEPPRYEVQRIIKSFVDAQWLAEFDQKLEQYKSHISGKADKNGDTL